MNSTTDKDTSIKMEISIACVTDVGRVRVSNQDMFVVADLTLKRVLNDPGGSCQGVVGPNGWLLAVADGVGGAKAGDVASRLATERLAQVFMAGHGVGSAATELREAISEANQAIRDSCRLNAAYEGMAATLTAAIIRDGRAIIGQVGDSRGYLVRKGHIHQVTKDQSLVQSLIDAGQLTEEQAAHFRFRNILLYALGAQDEVDPDVGAVELDRGDCLLLCSDGLSNKVGNVEMHDIVHAADNLDAACQQLVDLANQRGGEDNITVIVARFAGEIQAKTADESEPVVRIEPL